MITDLDPMPPPARDRPQLPEGYGLPADDEGLLGWAEVESRLAASHHYWLSSVRPDGRPHSIPRWGVWVDGRFWYDGSPETRHARNAERNPAVTLTLEDGKEAVIVEGESQATRAGAAGLGARLAAAFEKYHGDGYAPEADAWSGDDGGGLRVLTPSRVLAWFSFPTDVTRFRW
ncbi:pyridoxamine 5'-phosphate oxidase family protein [Agrococcus sp. KRD186]|uniref:pyridoxamine 5'-phosphate oxidase family protein n=1 Tax=Agrococcus sp. KRD186 TaxID=2729730 RepID=UPI0019D2DBFB|nr:pyridoxamine 5'-phosphate oxidase family protein [Agrococcus sp. KRD186]